MRRLGSSLLCLALAAVSCATAPRPGLEIAPAAWVVANRVYADAVIAGKEKGLCLASNGYRHGTTKDGQPWVAVYRFAERGPQAAKIDSANYSTLWWTDNICGDSLPSWHTHLPGTDSLASKCDRQQLARRPRAPFWLVQHATSRVTILTLSTEERHELASDPKEFC